MTGWIKMPHGREAGLSTSDIMLEGDPAPLPKRARSPQFSAHVYCGQTAGWIKMPLGIEVGLGPGHAHCAKWGPSSPSPKRVRSFQFSAHLCCCQTARWMMPLSTEVDLSPGHIVLGGDPSSPAKGAQQPPPPFSAHVYCGHAHLSYC